MTQRDEREKLREALEFGIWSVSGPTNDAEIEMLEQQIEAAWQDYKKQHAAPADGDAHAEIQRLQDAKRRALAIADERAKENVALRAALEDVFEYISSDAEDSFRPAVRLSEKIRAALSNAPAEGPDPLGYAKGERL